MVFVPHDDLAAARAAHRIGRPAAAGRHPHHVRAVVGGRRHQHVVAVGHDHGVGMTGQPAAQCAFDVVDLADPVELVARQVQQHDDGRLDGVGDVRHVHLVDLERRQFGVACARERGHQPGVHVRALGVGGDGAQRGERGGGHPGGGRLAVRPGHDDGTTARARAGAGSTCRASSRRVRRSSRPRRDR